MAIAVLALWRWWAHEQTITGAPGASWALLIGDLAIAVALGMIVGTGATILALLVRRTLPVPFLIVFVSSALVLMRIGPGPSPFGWLMLSALVLMSTALLGALLGSLIAARGTGQRVKPRQLASGCAAAGALGIVAVMLTWSGTGTPAVLTEGTGEVTANPTNPGPHRVETITYGSGPVANSGRYGRGADVRTEPVDASGIIEGWAPDSLRSQVWGFDPAALPVNAVVWSPVDPGPHPLVLIVHGNAPHQDSELGFAYLGELLASRGFIVAALDQNFLNTTLLDRSSGIGGAEQARAWMVLQHLQQWEAWQDQDRSPLTARADLDRVALIGHSRGGEAALVATALHQADRDPDLPGTELAPGATINTVITLAPSDSTNLVAGEPVSLNDVHYLTITGSHDADVGSISGQDQYARTQIGEGEIKAAVTIYRANHSQFNSQWGRYDAGFGLSKHLQNSAALLSPDEQREATEAFVSAFLDRSLTGGDATGLFHGPLPQVSWLPRTDFRISRAVGDQAQIVDFTGLRELPEGMSIAGGKAEPTTFPPHATPRGNTVLHLLPDEAGQDVSLSLSPQDLTVEGHQRVVIDLAQARDPAASATAVTVELDIVDSTGAVATCPVTGPAGVPEQLPSRTVPWPLPATGPTSQPHLQTYAVDPDCIAHSDVDLAEVDTLIFRIAGLPAEGIYVDHVGVAELH